MARPKIYRIKLSDEERATLNKAIHTKKTCKTVLKRCQISLELDELHRDCEYVFPVPEARRIAKKLEIHFTPKHGRWLNIAEIELNFSA